MTGKALVLGAAGFLGRAAATRLAELGYDVAGLGHGDWPEVAARASGLRHWQSGPITEGVIDSLLGRFGRPDVVVHAGGAGTVSEAWRLPLTAFERTVASTAAVLESLRKQAPDALLIFASSAAVYGEQPQRPIREIVPQAPVSPYGTHKQLLETLALGAARDFNQHVVLIRFFSLYGRGLRKQLLFDLSQRLARGDKSILLAGDGSETRDFFHVDDAARLITKLIDKQHTNGVVINGGTGVPITVRRAAKALIEAFGSDARLGFSGANPAGNPSHMCADVTKLEKLGFSPDISFEAGIADYVTWFKEQEVKAA